MKEKISGIYVLENIVNGKCYVGQSINIKKRMKDHRRTSPVYVIDRAVAKYGWNAFKKYEFHIPKNLLDFFETEMIKKLNCLTPLGYNISPGGSSQRTVSEETRKKLSEAGKGRKHSEETKRLIRETNKGKHFGKRAPFSEVHKIKIGEAIKGRKRAPFSEETKKRMSNSAKKRWS